MGSGLRFFDSPLLCVLNFASGVHMRQPENRRIEGLTPTLYSPVESFGSAAEIGMLDHDSREVFHDAIKNHIDGYRRLLPRPLL